MNDSLISNNDSEPDQCTYSKITKIEQWIQVGAYIFVIVSSLLGNFLVICVVYRNQRMRTVTHYFIVNTTIADLLITSFGMPVTLRELILGNEAIDYGGITGAIFCKMLSYTEDVSISCSILTLVAIATDRYCVTFFPLKRLVTTRMAMYVIGIIWLISFIIPSPLLYAMKVEQVEDDQFYCYEDWKPFFSPNAASYSFTITLFISLYAVPLLVISILYGAVILRIWKRKIPGEMTIRGRRLQARTKKTVLKMLISVIICFALCWLPYHVLFFLGEILPEYTMCGFPLRIWFFCRFLSYGNSSFTPWIYAIFSQDYRKGFKDVLSCCCHKSPSLFHDEYWVVTRQSTQGDMNEQGVQLKTFVRTISTTELLN